MTKFAPKSAETLRSEIVTNYGIDPEANKELIDKMVADRVKDEEFKASLHTDKNKHLTRKEVYKNKLKELGYETDPKTGELVKKEAPKGDQKQNQEADLDTLVAEKVFLKNGGTRTEARMIRGVMKTFNISFEKAERHKVFIGWKKVNDEENKAKGAQLPPSRGGTPTKKGVEPANEKEEGFLDSMGVKKDKK